MASTMEKLKYDRDTIRLIGQKYGASNIRIFGSVLYAEDRPDSDIDLLVDFDSERSLFDLIGLKIELEEFLGKKVDVVTKRGLHPEIADHVLREAISL